MAHVNLTLIRYLHEKPLYFKYIPQRMTTLFTSILCPILCN